MQVDINIVTIKKSLQDSAHFKESHYSAHEWQSVVSAVHKMFSG